MGRWDEVDERVYQPILWGFMAVAALVLLILQRLNVPYGRYIRRGWGPTLPVVDGWILMESPALWASFLVNAFGRHKAELVPKVILRFYQLHYIHRTLIFPFRLRADGKRMPYLVAACGFLFNVCNAYLQARWISHLTVYPAGWLTSPQFLLGATLFAAGMVINIWSDSVLINLRYSKTDSSYRIPRGALFELVSCPNYFGEALEWLGWAVLSWSLPGLVFFAATVANLFPRALAHHAWYRKKYADYPRRRKAVVPYLL